VAALVCSGDGVAVAVSGAGSDVGSVVGVWLWINALLGDVDGELSGDVDGGLSGDVDGELSGDVDGGLSGDVDGELSGDVDGELLGDVEGELLGDVADGVGGELLGGVVEEGTLLPSVGVPVGDGTGGVPGSSGGASPRIATISALNASSRTEISASEYAVMVFPSVVSRSQTSPSESSCSLLGVSSTDSTSWLARAAVMQR
jgi:hypothetical protein